MLPLLYLHGLSTGDFVPALGRFLGSSAGLSAPVITRLAGSWQAEQRAFAARDLSGADYVYLWADGIHPGCDARHLGQQRCDECNTWCRRLCPGGLCPCCDEPVAIFDLLSSEQLAPVRPNRGR